MDPDSRNTVCDSSYPIERLVSSEGEDGLTARLSSHLVTRTELAARVTGLEAVVRDADHRRLADSLEKVKAEVLEQLGERSQTLHQGEQVSIEPSSSESYFLIL